jgi:glycerol-3-phosphate O-acyltransferase
MWQIDDSTSIAAVVFAHTATERAVLDSWVAAARPAATAPTVIVGDDLGRDSQVLSLSDSTLLVPLRVAWLPPSGERRSRWRPALSALSAGFRRDWLQSNIARKYPERCRVVVGEPATYGEMRARFERDTSGAESLSAFVKRQAALALDRAQRVVMSGQKMPRFVLDEVKAGKRFADSVARLSQETGLAAPEVAAQAVEYLEEMSADHSRIAIELFDRFGRFLTRAHTVNYDRAQFEALRELNHRHSLVFLPTHRSYIDSFFIQSALKDTGMPANFTFGGNNMDFWPMGDWMRRTGKIVLRRDIGGNVIYKDVLRTYLQYLIEKRLNLEWYIEGGRTRTGKLRPPKYGLLTYLVDAFDEMGGDTDVYLVPVSLVYDGLPEVASLAAEQTGTQKKNEQINWLINYPRSTGGGFGKVHLSVGEPLSLAQALLGQDRQSRRARVQKVAFEVCHRINEATPVGASALVTFALLRVGARALTFDELRNAVTPFLDYAARRKLPVTVDLADPVQLRAVLGWLSRTGVLTCYDGGLETVWGIAPDRHLDAAFYRNSVVHHLVDRAILELVLAAAAEGTVSTAEEGWREALRLRDILKFEFFFPDRRKFMQNLAAEIGEIDADWSSHVGDAHWWSRALAETQPHLAHATLHAYFEAYYVTADRLAARPPEQPVQEKTFIKECFGYARQRYMQLQLQSSDAISTEVFKNALLVAAHRDLMGPGGSELAARRRQFASELEVILRRIEAMDRADANMTSRPEVTP